MLFAGCFLPVSIAIVARTRVLSQLLEKFVVRSWRLSAEMLPSQQLIVALLILVHTDLSIRYPGKAQHLPEALHDPAYAAGLKMHLCSLSLSLCTNSPFRSTKVPEEGRCRSPVLRFVVMRRKLIFATSSLCKSVIFKESVSFRCARILALASFLADTCAGPGSRCNKLRSSL